MYENTLGIWRLISKIILKILMPENNLHILKGHKGLNPHL